MASLVTVNGGVELAYVDGLLDPTIMPVLVATRENRHVLSPEMMTTLTRVGHYGRLKIRSPRYECCGKVFR